MRTRDLNSFDILVIIVVAVVGALAIIALASPELVAWGSFLVVPFLLLFPAPTLALYVIPFALLYFAARRWDSFIALIAGGLASTALTIGLPMAWNRSVSATQEQESEGDQAPRHPAQLAGAATLLDQDAAGDVACGQLCTTLLYAGKVREVTVIADGRRENPRTFVLQSGRAPCRLTTSDDLYLDRFLPAEAAKERALLGDCIIRQQARPPGDRWIVELKHLPRYARRGERRGGPARITIWFQRAGEAPHLVARQTASESRRLMVPLFVDLAGSPNSGAYWRLGAPRHDAKAELKPMRDFIDPASLDVRPVTPESLRDGLDNALDSKSSADDQLVSVLMFAVLRDVEPHPQSGDADRVERIVRDARSFGQHLRVGLQLFPDRSASLRDAALAHLADLPPGPELEGYARDLAGMPKGAFEAQWQVLAELAKDRQRRPWISPIIHRVADGGTPAAKTLFFLLDDSIDNPITYSPSGGMATVDHSAAEAAAAGLCILGPAIAPAFQRAMRLDGSPPEMRQGMLVAPSQQWAVWQIRLGRPRSTIAAPNAPRDWWHWVDERIARADCTSA